MFILTTIADLVQIAPEDFTKPSAQALEDNINRKYANKVIQKIGLCICLYDILTVSDGLIGHGTGIVNVNVEFRLVVFRPFKGEILQGKILGSSHLGIRIHMGFYEDIFVPGPVNLFEGSEFDVAEQVWVWKAEGENGTEELYFDTNEVVRFRVEAEVWHDQSPQAPMADDASDEERKTPYSIIASMQQGGLGPTMWW
ncbi:DNA-directed rna polymerase III 25 kd polypeptide [Lineolata rhizophorae]|uniref:DNA-directed RNA polymerase subunit n=1 Tax=Lineolata rhizophorae TaxID=578093 RepID=A0A6A6NML7_9PEZI|nr:DNA-directed rna polymerase III 25 kd polypeptide [Lineolata rhizophorae]